jgi:DNA gyrase subunit A
MTLPVPDIRDGLALGSRRVLLAAQRAAATSDPDTVNTYKALHAAWEADRSQSFDELFSHLLRMAQPWSCRYPLLQPGGHFGSIDGATASPAYYTRVELSKIGSDVVGTTPNASIEDPGVLLSTFPQLLCNGSFAHTGLIDLDCESACDPGPEPPGAYYRVPTGRLVGGKLEAFLPPHHLGRACEALAYLADHPRAELREILPILGGPDFPTGGRVMNSEDLEEIYTVGEGVLKVRARTSFTKDADGTSFLLIQELPFGMTTGALLPWLLREGAVEVEVVRPPKDPIGYQVQIRVNADSSRSSSEDLAWSVLQREIQVRMAVVCDGRPQIVSLLQLLRGHLETMRKLLDLRSDDRSPLHTGLRRWIERSDQPRSEIVRQ